MPSLSHVMPGSDRTSLFPPDPTSHTSSPVQIGISFSTRPDLPYIISSQNWHLFTPRPDLPYFIPSPDWHLFPPFSAPPSPLSSSPLLTWHHIVTPDCVRMSTSCPASLISSPTSLMSCPAPTGHLFPPPFPHPSQLPYPSPTNDAPPNGIIHCVTPPKHHFTPQNPTSRSEYRP